MTTIDHTHDPAARSCVPGADGHPDFPIQNLPLGVFSPGDGVARPASRSATTSSTSRRRGMRAC